MSPRILIVDDEEPICELLCDIFTDEGYRVATAGDGRAALVALADDGFDLVLSDIMLPRVDGRELVNAMHANPDLNKIPVVLMSAAEGLPARGVPHAAFIRKPFDLYTLLNTVERVLGEGERANTLPS